MTQKFNPQDIHYEPQALELLSIWRSWGETHQQAYQDFQLALPESTAEIDFRWSQKWLSLRNQKVSSDGKEPHLFKAGEMIKPGQFRDYQSAHRYWAADIVLMTAPMIWSWAPEVIDLRERVFEEHQEGSATQLAKQMMGYPHAPWRRWSAASPIAKALWSELDQLNHQEPLVLSSSHYTVSSISLAAMLGLFFHPIKSYIKKLSKACSAELFLANTYESHDRSISDENYFKSQDPFLIQAADDWNKKGSPFSFGSLFSIASRRPLELEWRLDCMNKALNLPNRHPDSDREKDQMTLETEARSALNHPFMSIGLTQHKSGLPAEFKHHWPMSQVLSDLRFPSQWIPSLEHLIDQGARSTDMDLRHSGLMVWETALRVGSEQGSEGPVAPMDETLMQCLVESGANFNHTALLAFDQTQSSSFKRTVEAKKEEAQAEGKSWPIGQSLKDYYQMALNPYRYEKIKEFTDSWMEKSHAKAEQRSLDEVTPKPNRQNSRKLKADSALKRL